MIQLKTVPELSALTIQLGSLGSVETPVEMTSEIDSQNRMVSIYQAHLDATRSFAMKTLDQKTGTGMIQISATDARTDDGLPANWSRAKEALVIPQFTDLKYFLIVSEQQMLDARKKERLGVDAADPFNTNTSLGSGGRR
jgi:hypothetical protein